MAKPLPRDASNMQQLVEFTRRILSVPKEKIDAKLAKEKTAKKRRK